MRPPTLPTRYPRNPPQLRARWRSRGLRTTCSALALCGAAALALPPAVTQTLTQTLGGSTAQAQAAGRSGRPGLRIRFASIDGQDGMEGSAFLLFSSRRVALDATRPPAACAGAHVVRAEARGSRGLMQKVTLSLVVRGVGDAPISDSGCPSASLRAELEDGSVLSGGEGMVHVERAALSAGGEVSGTYSWTVMRGGAPFPMRGEFRFTLPEG